MSKQRGNTQKGKRAEAHLSEVDALLKEGISLFEQRDYEEATAHLQEALTKKSRQTAAIYYFLARIEEEKNHQKSYDLYLRAYDAMWEPGCRLNFAQRIDVMIRLAHVCLELGHVWEAAAHYYNAYELDVKTIDTPAQRADTLSGYLMSLAAADTIPQEILAGCREFGKVMRDCAEKLPMPESEVCGVSEGMQGKIHLAYISPDFQRHVMYSFYYPLLAGHDRDKFYVSCISVKAGSDECTAKVRELADNYVEMQGLTWPELAAKLKSMRIDILVDLAGHSADTALPVFAYRVATVQISGLGWMETTGFYGTDYLITDEYLDPTDKSYITEKPLYLTSQYCYTCHLDTSVPEMAPCRRKGYVTFGSFNRALKFTNEILELWRRIMYLVPGSKLLLKCGLLSNKSGRLSLRKRFMQVGLDNSRIIFEPPSKEDYLERYLDVDIALDTYPYAGGGTTFDALYMGVPVISMYGERRSSRFGLSILSNVGVGELAVATPREYVQRAVVLAKDWDVLDVLHKNLRTMLMKSPAMDAKRYVTEMEAQYERVLVKARMDE